MSEIPSQNESQAWKRELKLHPEGYPILRPEESLALMGSWTEEKLEDTLEGLEGSSEAEQERQTRVMRAAMDELPGLDAQFGVLQALADRQSVLEKQLKEATDRKNARASTEIRTKLAGLDFLLGEYDGIEANIKLSGQTSKERSAYVNELITEHNERMSRGSESIADSPEAREAQARIDARFAEQAEQPQPRTETADEARRAVAEAFGDTGEKERQTLIGEVARAAKGATRIYTDIPKGIMLKSDSGDFRPIDGFNSFGDGLSQDSNNPHRGNKLEYDGSAEAFIFEPDTTIRYKTAMRTVETGGRFFKRTQQVEDRVSDSEVPTMVVNHATGQQEPGIKVAYQFNGGERKDKASDIVVARYEGPSYETGGGRPGNRLFVEATLPKSVADKLKQEVARNPNIAREFAKTLAMNNGITEQAWDNGVRPPYDQIPDGWEMTLAELQKDTQYGGVRHNVTHQQSLQVN